MIFNSWVFVVFFILVYLVYLRLGHLQQNILLLVAGWVFYGFWDPRFLLLLWASTIVDYGIGLALDKASNTRFRRLLVILSVVINLSFLGVFKYCDFFIHSAMHLLSFFGFKVSFHTLGIIVPVGLSFYTFQSLGYTIGVYRQEVKACLNFLNYAVYVSFFPQLVAGPIERAKHLIAQVEKPRLLTWPGIKSGLWLILKGYFLKVFVADNLINTVDPVFSATNPTGAQVLIGIYAFAFQIYGDFAGYSNIARGISRLMGFDLMVNFSCPYFATNPSDFWKRWHISLSTWLRDFLYISLGGNRKGHLRTYFNLMITMLLGGLWHGAAWTYVIWGFYHGVLLCIYKFKSEFKNGVRFHIPQWIRIVFYFHLTCIGWLFFRSNSIQQVFLFLYKIIFFFQWDKAMWGQCEAFLFLIIPVVCLDLGEEYGAGPDAIGRWAPSFRYAVYFGMFCLIYIFGSRGGAPFIYFQF